jgi:hypothetical protein
MADALCKNMDVSTSCFVHLESAFQPIGEAVWYEYEFTIESARGSLRGQGMALCRKNEWSLAYGQHAPYRRAFRAQVRIKGQFCVKAATRRKLAS